jgi:hypothetical protein
VTVPAAGRAQGQQREAGPGKFGPAALVSIAIGRMVGGAIFSVLG